ncbi:hypothetical protein [Microbacterium sp. BR1]|uniref:hypothetical protein n=1 Tax=Microbacterium sp. BR1 TaxID=1070896 RepID=UPI000C2C1579|nr:hypothetical protein [Microbacterium sp. BR1]
MEAWFVTLFVTNVALAAVVGYAATQKGRSGFGFFMLAFLFSFLVGILVLLAMPAVSTTSPRSSSSVADRRASIAQSKLEVLTRVQYQQWEAAGRPDIAIWDGVRFEEWLDAQGRP